MPRAFVLILLLLLSVSLFVQPTAAQEWQGQDTQSVDSTASADTTADPFSTDCGADLDCFSGFAQVCSPATVTWFPSVDLLGIRWYSATRMHIQEQLDDQCMVQVRLLALNAHFTQDMVQQSLDAGVSWDDILAAEQETDQQAAAYAGTVGTCAFPSADFPTTIERWKLSGFTAEDWGLLQCNPT